MNQQIKSKRKRKLEDIISIDNNVVTVYLDKCNVKLDLEDYQAIKAKGYGVFCCHKLSVQICLNHVNYSITNVLFNIKEKESILHIDGDKYNFCRDNCIVINKSICTIYHKYKNRNSIGSIGHMISYKNTNTKSYNINVHIYYNNKKIPISLTSKSLKGLKERFIKEKIEPFLDSLGLLNIKSLSKEDINKYKNHSYIYNTKKINRYTYKIKYEGEDVYLYFNDGSIVIYDKDYYEDAINKGYCPMLFKNNRSCIFKKNNEIYERISTYEIRIFLNGNKFDYRKSNCIIVPINIKNLYNKYINNNWHLFYNGYTSIYKVIINKYCFGKSSTKSKEDAFEKFKNEVIIPIIEPLLRSYGLIK